MKIQDAFVSLGILDLHVQLVLVHAQKTHAENLSTPIFQNSNARTTPPVELATHVTAKLKLLVIVEDIVKMRYLIIPYFRYVIIREFL